MAKHKLAKSHLIYALSPDVDPALRVQSGDTVEIETCDCFEDQIQDETQDFGTLDWNRINPATGPIYIEGAEPGDLLVVDILAIELAERGVMTTGPGLGVLGDELQHNAIRMIPIDNGHAVFAERLRLPLRPMIGVIGTAPKDNAIPCGTPGDHGGNMDCTRIGPGARLLLPVNVQGALFALGDLHAAMGDGEVGVSGIEIAGKVTVSLHVWKGSAWPYPMLIDHEHVMTIASAETLDAAAERAVKQMAGLLVRETGIAPADAVMLMSAAANLRVCQVVDPLKTARVELPKNLAEQLELKLPVFG
ncbi:amidase [Alicyclobacillus hesperidum]|uniref:Amidase n=1 Tax=Alicyclobacillus hesperidum TaxID=89784 RepID=A0A1H2XLQ8_9BACL|nr:acetamidase/formamidase family protein [Alicyclobacillus hesperidum]SDW93686.1 amidase [Alicyclobacillus hesperidum]